MGKKTLEILRKFTDIISLKNWQVETENGWEDIESINKTVPYRKFTISTESGKKLQCADDHIVIDEFGNEVLAKDSLGCRLKTKDGPETVVSVVDDGVEEPMYDLTLPEGSSHCYYTDGILSHNTTMLTIFALWYTIFNNDKTILLVANKEGTAKEVLSRIRLAYEELPVWLKPGVTEWQKESIKFANGSRIAISSTSATSGRSFSINCLLIDEASYIGHTSKGSKGAAADEGLAVEFFRSVLPTITSSKNSKLILTSTPNGAHGYFYDRLRDAMRGKSGWKYMSIPWTSIPGRDLEWYRNAMADCNNDPKFFAQEYACAFLEEGDAAFDKEYIEEMKRMAKEPPVLATEDYKVWHAPKPGHVYSMGVDVAEGVGDCASCIQIIDITDLSAIHQVACYNSKTIAPTPFAKKIVDIAHQWGDPWILVERNNMGAEVVSRLVGEPHYYPRVVAYDSTDETKAKRSGITSSTQSKYDGISNMRYYMNIMRAVDIPDMQTLVEFDTFIRWPNGTYKKSSDNGVYDDRVMALCWALFILHTPIAQKCLTVFEVSDTGKPSKIAPCDYQQNFIGIGVFSSDEKKPVTLDSVFGVGVPGDGTGGVVRHSVDEMDYEELLEAGWRRA